MVDRVSFLFDFEWKNSKVCYVYLWPNSSYHANYRHALQDLSQFILTDYQKHLPGEKGDITSGLKVLVLAP